MDWVGRKFFYRGQKIFFCKNIFPQEGFPSNIGWAAAHPAHTGPRPLCIRKEAISLFGTFDLISSRNLKSCYIPYLIYNNYIGCTIAIKVLICLQKQYILHFKWLYLCNIKSCICICNENIRLIAIPHNSL